MITAALACAAAISPPKAEPRPLVEMMVQNRGRVVLELRPDQAPKLTKHFLGLVGDGFYDNILFHRKVDGFVIQSGDPGTRGLSPAWARKNPGQMGGTEGHGSGGSGTNVPYEINELRHWKHTMGMALEAPMSDTGDSQFFINLDYNMRLYGKYCVFGRVYKRGDVVDSIQRGDRITHMKRIR